MANGSALPKESWSRAKRSKTGEAARRYRSFLACPRIYPSLVRLVKGTNPGSLSLVLIPGNHEPFNRLVLNESIHNLRDVGDRDAPVKKVIGFD